METHGQNKINCPCRTVMRMLSTRVGMYIFSIWHAQKSYQKVVGKRTILINCLIYTDYLQVGLTLYASCRVL